MSHSHSLLYAVHHVFLPPLLPQSNDQTVKRDRFLCEHVRQSIVAYQRRLPDSQKSRWNPVLRMVDNLASSQAFDVLSPEIIESQISHMRAGGTVIHCRHIKKSRSSEFLRRHFDIYHSRAERRSHTPKVSNRDRLRGIRGGPSCSRSDGGQRKAPLFLSWPCG